MDTRRPPAPPSMNDKKWMVNREQSDGRAASACPCKPLGIRREAVRNAASLPMTMMWCVAARKGGRERAFIGALAAPFDTKATEKCS